MCGIVGGIGNVKYENLEKAMSIISHRGPDNSGILLGNKICLGHQRLSIIDLSDKAVQPMLNENETIAIVYNGEIYNYKELKTELTNHIFKSNSDTEVILHAYEEWGEKCVEKLNGMFAFAIWDSKEKVLFIARDRAGIKPLYLYSDGETIMFASEIKSLFELGAKKELNKEILKDFFNYQISISNETLFEDIIKFHQGIYATIKNGVMIMKEYWRPEYTETEKTPEQLKKILEESVRRQMVSDVPVGTFLSGGLDSSIITAIASKICISNFQQLHVGALEKGVSMVRNSGSRILPAAERLKTFTAGFEGYEEEIKNAQEVSQSLGTEHHSILITPKMFIGALPELIYHYDQPISFASSVALYYVSKLASDNGVKVILTGEGADELFAGYSRYNRINKILKFTKGKPIIFGNKISFFSSLFLSDPRYLKMVELICNGNNYDYLTGVNSIFNERNNNHPWRPIVKRLYKDGGEGINGLLHLDWYTYLQELLTKQDRMSMAVSIESRVPYLDNEVIDFANSLLQGSKNKKSILKEAAKDILPADVINRKKIGFTVPLDKWFKGPLKEYINQELRDPIAYKFFGEDYVITTLEQQEENNCSLQLWAMLNFTLWYKMHFKDSI